MGYRSRERVSRILAHREADRVPYCAHGRAAALQAVDALGWQNDRREFAVEGDFAMVTIEPTVDASRFEGYLNGLPEGASLNYWGVGREAQTTAEGYHAGHRMFAPLAGVNSLEELRQYPFPDVVNSGADEGLEERIRSLQADGYTVLGQMSQTILETAYCMRGLPQLMLDFHDRPRYVEFLFETIVAQRRFQARRFAEAGVDILRIGDDIASQTSLIVGPALYQQWIKPYHAATIAEARAVKPDIPVKYHSDGYLTPLLPDLLDIGVTIINPVQAECMDLARTKQEFGEDLTLWGCMPCQSIMQHGSRQDVIDHLHLLMDHVAHDGGLVVKFTNFLSTKTSLANLRVFFEVFYDLGRY